MSHEYLLWISLAAYFLHIIEEFFFDWKAWAEKISKFHLVWRDFFIINALLLILGAATTLIGWRIAWLGLFIPSLELINGLFFHLIPTIALRKMSPGIISSCVLFIPLGIICFWGAHLDSVLTTRVIILSFTLALLAMIFPFLFFFILHLLRAKR